MQTARSDPGGRDRQPSTTRLRNGRNGDAPRIELGARIRKARLELGLSLAQVSGTDFSRSFLNQIELGKARPSTRTLQIIAERLHRPIEYFLQDPRDSITAIELVLAEAGTRLRQGDMQRARTLVVSLLAQPRLTLEARLRAELILAEALLRLGLAAEAIKVLQSAVQDSEKGAWPLLTVELSDRMGSAYYLLRQPNEAARWFDRALSLYEAKHLQDPLVKARVLGHRANLHYLVGAAHEAIAGYEAAIAAAGHVLDMQALGGIYEGLALSFQQTGDLSRALTFAQRSLRLFETLHDVRMSAQLRNNMSEILLEQGRPADAERHLIEGAAQLRQVGDRDMLPHLLAGLAEAALDQDQPLRALAQVQEALEMAATSQDPVAAMVANRVAGRIHTRNGELGFARACFDEALRLATTTGSGMATSRIAYDYAQALERAGDIAGAMSYYRQAYQVRRPIFDSVDAAAPTA